MLKIIFPGIILSLFLGCTTYYYTISSYVSLIQPDGKSIKYNKEVSDINYKFNIRNVSINVRPSIYKISRSTSDFYIEHSRTKYKYEQSYSNIAVGFSRVNANVFLKNISGTLIRLSDSKKIYIDNIYFNIQQGCTIEDVVSKKIFRSNKKLSIYNFNPISIQHSDNFESVFKWSNDQNIDAKSCFQFVYNENIDPIDIYRMQIGELIFSDGSKEYVNIYLIPGIRSNKL